MICIYRNNSYALFFFCLIYVAIIVQVASIKLIKHDQNSNVSIGVQQRALQLLLRQPKVR